MSRITKKWFETRREANAHIEQHFPRDSTIKVFKWKHTKRKKSFFVGSYIEWLNAA